MHKSSQVTPLVLLALAFVAFFLPWSSSYFNGQELQTQSGFQSMIGKSSLGSGAREWFLFKSQDSFDSFLSENRSATDAEIAGLVGVFFAFLVLTTGLRFGALKEQKYLASIAVYTAATALILLLIQIFMGLPMQKDVQQYQDFVNGAKNGSSTFSQVIYASLKNLRLDYGIRYGIVVEIVATVLLVLHSLTELGKRRPRRFVHQDRPYRRGMRRSSPPLPVNRR